MKFPEILIGKPIDPFPSASLDGSTEYTLGWQEDLLHARPGGLRLRKTPNPFPGGYLPTSEHGYCKGQLHAMGSPATEAPMQSWRHRTDSEGPPLVRAEISQEQFSPLGLVLRVS